MSNTPQSKTTTPIADIAYDPTGEEIVVNLPHGHLVRIVPSRMKRVIIPGIGTFTKTEDWHEVGGI